VVMSTKKRFPSKNRPLWFPRSRTAEQRMPLASILAFLPPPHDGYRLGFHPKAHVCKNRHHLQAPSVVFSVLVANLPYKRIPIV
jgi:hypothetical protein